MAKAAIEIPDDYLTGLRGCADALEGSRYHLLMAQTGYSDGSKSRSTD